MNTKTRRKRYNAPAGAQVIPVILILINHYWGKGATIEEAWTNVRKEAGGTVAKLKREPHIIYSGFDYVTVDKETTVKMYVDGMGAPCYHRDYPPTIIHKHKTKN